MQFKQLAKGFIGVMLLTTLAACGSGNTSSSSEKESKEKL
ncbi:TPA: phosphate/phosphite/phosphonate ABC transporter substrate-binding protein, partial [Enterococcus faecium]|nr:phosphate/phosphite/phosphonate ABC transporter substrate-binding protein [Enterococcus faecium]